MGVLNLIDLFSLYYGTFDLPDGSYNISEI